MTSAAARGCAIVLAWLALVHAPTAQALEGEVLWKRLREGGLVLLIRHAETEPGVGDPARYRIGDCASQRNLSEAGREESRRLGERLRKEGVAIERAYTSPWCRCRDTANLAFGKSEDWAALASTFDVPHREAELSERVRKRIGTYSTRKPKGNIAMVTHNLNIAALTKLSVATGEIVVVRPDGCCSLRVLGRLLVK